MRRIVLNMIIRYLERLLNRSQMFFKQTSVPPVEDSTRSLTICYISFHIINFPPLLLYLFPATMKFCYLGSNTHSLIDRYRHFREKCCLQIQDNLPAYVSHIPEESNLHVKPYLGKIYSTNPDLISKDFVTVHSHTDTSIHPGFQNKSLITERKEMK
jgi:hypothetical protein